MFLGRGMAPTPHRPRIESGQSAWLPCAQRTTASRDSPSFFRGSSSGFVTSFFLAFSMFCVMLTVMASALMEAEHCDIAIVGAGPGGIYAAWRLIEANHTGKICMYERSQRFGGRIFSLRQQGPKKDLVVDMGAYRFVDKPSHEGHW